MDKRLVMRIYGSGIRVSGFGRNPSPDLDFFLGDVPPPFPPEPLRLCASWDDDPWFGG